MSELAGVDVQPLDGESVTVTYTWRPAEPLAYTTATFRVYDRVSYLWTRKGARKTRRMKGRRPTDPAAVQRMLARYGMV